MQNQYFVGGDDQEKEQKRTNETQRNINMYCTKYTVLQYEQSSTVRSTISKYCKSKKKMKIIFMNSTCANKTNTVYIPVHQYDTSFHIIMQVL